MQQHVQISSECLFILGQHVSYHFGLYFCSMLNSSIIWVAKVFTQGKRQHHCSIGSTVGLHGRVLLLEFFLSKKAIGYFGQTLDVWSKVHRQQLVGRLFSQVGICTVVHEAGEVRSEWWWSGKLPVNNANFNWHRIFVSENQITRFKFKSNLYNLRNDYSLRVLR